MRAFWLRWGPLVASIGVGGTLIYASIHKIADPRDFVKILLNYRTFPATALNPLAIWVPWVEAIAGAALITGIGRRGAACIATGLFATFIAVLSYNLARDCPTICGCFSTFAANAHLTPAEKFAEMRSEIWFYDVPLLALSLWVLVASFARGRSRAS